MPRAVNPYIAGKPVKGTDMFFGRDDVFEFITERLTGRYQDSVILIHGQPRTGKTSILYQMSRHVHDRYLCVLVDLHGFALQGMDGFLKELAGHIERSLLRDHQVSVPPPDPAKLAADAHGYFADGFLDDVSRATGDRRLLLMLDEVGRVHEQVQAGALERDVFDYVRHLMQHHRRLNFLLSLGNEFEEMKKEYANLFSLGLYKRVSFLDRKAAERLITDPVKDLYTIERAARDRILALTNCHPYYTQLLCHCLFTRCQRERLGHVEVSDVDAVLDEVIELGAPNLQSVWQEASSGEKALMAGLAADMGGGQEAVTIRQVRELWAGQEVVLPAEEVARALESLTAREVITSRQPHRFTVDLHRLWLSRHRSLEWVRNEIDGSITEWRQPPALATTPRPSGATAHPPRPHDQAAEHLGADEPVRSSRRSDSPRFRIRWISDWPVVPTEEQARVPLSTWARKHRLAPDDLFDGRLEVVDKTNVIVQEEWVEESRIEALQRRPGRFPVESLGLPTYRGSIQQAPGPPNKWTSQVWRGLLDGSTSVLECRLCINGKVRCSKCEGDGYVECKREQKCPDCRGIGTTSTSRGSERSTCSRCHGVKTIPCRECRGRGYKPCPADGCRDGRVRCPQCENHLCYTTFRIGTVRQTVHATTSFAPSFRLLQAVERIRLADIPERYRSQVETQVRPQSDHAVRRRFNLWVSPRFEVRYDHGAATRTALLLGDDLRVEAPDETRFPNLLRRLLQIGRRRLQQTYQWGRRLLQGAWGRPATRSWMVAVSVLVLLACAAILLHFVSSR